MIKKNITVSKEYFPSLIFNELVKIKKKIIKVNIDYFIHWGVPDQLEDYKNWYENLKRKLKSNVTYKLISLEKIYDCNFEFKTENWLLIDFAGKRTKFVKKLVESKNENLPAQIIFDNSEWYRNIVNQNRSL